MRATRGFDGVDRSGRWAGRARGRTLQFPQHQAHMGGGGCAAYFHGGVPAGFNPSPPTLRGTLPRTRGWWSTAHQGRRCAIVGFDTYARAVGPLLGVPAIDGTTSKGRAMGRLLPFRGRSAAAPPPRTRPPGRAVPPVVDLLAKAQDRAARPRRRGAALDTEMARARAWQDGRPFDGQIPPTAAHGDGVTAPSSEAIDARTAP